jgi:hypothetical protein
VRLIRDPAHPISLLLTAAAIKSSASVVGCVLTITDITDRKRAEEARQASQAMLAAALESMTDGYSSLMPRATSSIYEVFATIYKFKSKAKPVPPLQMLAKIASLLG